MGDLKVNFDELKELGQIPNVVSITGRVENNSEIIKSSAHILIDRKMTREYTGRSCVSEQSVVRVPGDAPRHTNGEFLPIWAEFSAYEMPRFEDVNAQPIPNR